MEILLLVLGSNMTIAILRITPPVCIIESREKDVESEQAEYVQPTGSCDRVEGKSG